MIGRRRVWLVSLVAAFASAPDANADDGGVPALALTVAATCERATGPGRVRCDVDVRTSSPHTLRWADVQVVETPRFLSPLKGRVGPLDASVREPELVRFALGMVARERGTGEVRLRVRALFCTENACIPVTHDARARVVIGPDLP